MIYRIGSFKIKQNQEVICKEIYMTREEIEMEISRIEDKIADLNNQIEILNSMLDDLEEEESEE